MANKNFWQNLGDAIKYARSTSALDGGGAYYVTSQAKEDLREQGKEDEAKQIEKAEAIGTVGGAIAGLTLGKGVPLITRGISAFRTAFPKVTTGIDLVLTADGIRNLATENGIQKTVNYIKGGNWGRAALSGTVDALDLLGGVGLVGDGYRLIKPYGKGVLNRTKEAILREGDYLKDAIRNWKGMYKERRLPNWDEPMFPTWKQFFNRNTLKYIFNPKADPNLAYQMPYKYSGQQFLDDGATSLAHKDDLIDIVMGKSNVLRDETGNVIGELSSDTKYIPQETLDHLLEMTDKVLVLRPVDNMSEILSSRGLGKEALDIRNQAIREGNLGKALSRRGNSPRVQISKPGEFGGPYFVDPGHFGYSVWRGPNGYQLIGNDIYHYNLKRFGQTHLKTSVLPDVNMSQPIIVQWPINFRKNGGSIHIKEENKGKFTDYCGGKVTEECIRKGKNSSNPTTRKRATFAQNARRWKHQDGGNINYLNIF